MVIYREGKYIEEPKDATIRFTLSVIAKKELVSKGNDIYGKYSLNISKKNMIIEFIKTLSFVSISDFDADSRIINLENGLYYIDGLKIPNTDKLKYFESHLERKQLGKDPYKSLIQIPVKYNPKAENLEIDQILSDIFGFENVPLIYEMIAYFLLPTVKYGKGFMLYGDTGTGKTTVINIIKRFVGMNNISGISLQDLDVKFELEKTRNKLINIFDDLSSRPLGYVGNFKRLVTNSTLHGRIKFQQREIKWNNRCKGLFSCNYLPKIKEYVTDAFYTRWVLIPCSTDLKEKGLDREIRDKKWSEQEMSGLLNKVLQALQRLEERGDFPEEWQDIEFVKNYWNMDINPVALFVEECCDIDPLYEVDYLVFYTQLNKFRKERMVKEISKTLMTKSLKKINEKIVKKKVNLKSAKIEIFPSGNKFIGINFKPGFIEEDLKIESKPTLSNYLDIN
jgi:putative DNA primase/helicase